MTTRTQRQLLACLVCLLAATLASCALVMSFDYDTSDPTAAPAEGGTTVGELDGAPPARHAVTGIVDGLEDGAKVGIELNGGAALTVGNGPFAFPTELADGMTYAVAVAAVPEGHICSVERGTGTIQGADARDVAVHCPSLDATLTALDVSTVPAAGGALAFDPATLNYAVDLDAHLAAAMPFATLTPTPRNPGAMVTVRGALVAAGAASAPVLLDVGANAIDVKVTAPSGATATYTVTVVVHAVGLTYLKASNTRLNARFGIAVAASADTVAIGAPGESSAATGVDGDQSDTSTSNAGAVYVFVRSNGAWSQQAYLKASNTKANAGFGASVALEGDTLAVGAYGESSGATGINGNQSNTAAAEAGAVYVFTRSAGTWSQQAYVKASNTREKAKFGASVAISGNTLVVGAPGESSGSTGIGGDESNTSAPGGGAAYVFFRSGSTWHQQAYVKASNTRESARFGSSVAISADTLLVGAEGESSNATGIGGDQANTDALNAGAAYVYTRSGAAWSHQAYVKPSNTSANMRFGCAVAVSGDAAAVGACREPSNATGIDGNAADTSAPSAGAAYVLRRSGVTWSQEAYVKPSNTRGGQNFGGALALEGDTLVATALHDSSGATGVNGDDKDLSAPTSGAAFLFRRIAGTWSQRAYVKATNARTNAPFGSSVALTSGTLLVGSHGEQSNATGVNGDPSDTSLPFAGAAYVY